MGHVKFEIAIGGGRERECRRLFLRDGWNAPAAAGKQVLEGGG